ncbi:hypothetical protein ACVBEF_17350, partial [Glaciimonas sp. GG7]
DKETTPTEDILPVGMLVNEYGAAKAMANVATRKKNIVGWEPFHYEKISATEYEVTGGIPAIIGGAKKWPEPHTTVMVSEEELAQNLAVDLWDIASDSNEHIVAVTVHNEAQSTSLVSDRMGQSSAMPKYLTVILRMPADAAGHQRIAEMLALDKDFFGATVMATAFQDDILVSRSLQKQ